MNLLKKKGLKPFLIFCMLMLSTVVSAIDHSKYQKKYRDNTGLMWYLQIKKEAQIIETNIDEVPDFDDLGHMGECIIVGWSDVESTTKKMQIPDMIRLPINEVVLYDGLYHKKRWEFFKVVEVNSSAMTDEERIGSKTTFIELPKYAAIGEGAFKGMDALEHVWIEDWQGEKLPKQLFEGCKKLKTLDFTYNETGVIKINSWIKVIGENTFQNTGLTSVDLSKTQITTIDKNAFGGSGELASVKLPKTLETIGTQVFRYNFSLTSIDFTDTQVTHIANEAFLGCSKLSDVKLSDKVTHIETSAFASCAIREFRMPETVESIGDMAFGGGKSNLPEQPLERMYFTRKNAPRFLGSPFRGANKNAILYVPVDCSSSYKTALGASSIIGPYSTPSISVETDARNRVREQMTISKYGYNSYYLETENFLVPENVTAYVVTGRTNDKRAEVITYNSGNAVPPKNGFFLYAPNYKEQTIDYEAFVDGTKEIKIQGTAANLMVGTKEGTTVSATGGEKCYILAAGPQKTLESVGFYYQAGTAGNRMSLKAHSAGLKLPANIALSKRFGFSFFDLFEDAETTGIETVGKDKMEYTKQVVVYDLQGRRVYNPTRGLYIVNGKKVFVK